MVVSFEKCENALSPFEQLVLQLRVESLSQFRRESLDVLVEKLKTRSGEVRVESDLFGFPSADLLRSCC